MKNKQAKKPPQNIFNSPQVKQYRKQGQDGECSLQTLYLADYN